METPYKIRELIRKFNGSSKTQAASLNECATVDRFHPGRLDQPPFTTVKKNVSGAKNIGA